MLNTKEAELYVKPLRISSRQIQLLCALDKYRNMRRAAQAMHTTQPAASLVLQQLENRLSMKLFERQQRGMEPTIYGEVLIRFAKGVSQDFQHVEAEIADLSEGALGLIRIGSVYGAMASILRDRLIVYKKDFPRARVFIEVATSDTLIPRLINGDLDLVFGRIPDNFENNELEIDFFQNPEQMSVIARPGHPLAQKKKVSLSDLYNLTWILSPVESPMRSRVEFALRMSKMTTSLDIIETGSLLATTSLIESSDMISVMPYDVAMHYARYGMVTILRVELPISMVNLGIIKKKNRELSPIVTKFLEYLK